MYESKGDDHGKREHASVEVSAVTLNVAWRNSSWMAKVFVLIAFKALVTATDCE